MRLFKTFLTSMTILAMVSCANEVDEVVESSPKTAVIYAVIEDNAETKIILGDDTGDFTEAYWEEDDVLTVTVDFLKSYTFHRTDGAGHSKTATFEYFDENNPLPELIAGDTRISIVASRFQTNQSGKKENIGDYLSLNSDIIADENTSWENLPLSFQPQTSILKLTLKNDDFKGKVVKNISFIYDYYLSGSTESTTSYVMASDKFTGSSDDGTLTVYLSVANRSVYNCRITAMCEGSNYQASFENSDKVLESGYLYRVSKTMKNVGAVDLSPAVEGYESVYATANCYITTGPGAYKFRTTHKGNGTGESDKLEFDNVKVLWEFRNSGTKIWDTETPLTLFYDKDEGYISFECGDLGNALIAAVEDMGTADESDDKIVWSWHIWMMDVTPESHTYYVYDQTENKFTSEVAGVMMDRNLGAIGSHTATRSMTSRGMLYQWGRKDPFVMSSSRNTDVEYFSPYLVEVDNQTGTIDYSVSHPLTFISAPEHNDWCSEESEATRWAEIKTIYDPCPYGWKVPDAEFLYKVGMDTNGSYDSTQSWTAIISNADATYYYCANGIRNASDGSLSGSGNYGVYWTTSSNDEGQATSLSLKVGDYIDLTPFGMANACTVRCIKE